MPANRRKKDTRMRGSHTHGWGSKKKHRGSGNRGGKGMASTGKRSDAFKPSIWKEEYFGKHGFWHRGAIIHDVVNVSYIDQNIEKLAGENLAKAHGGSYEINIADLGFDKILGDGKVKKKLMVTARYASARSIDAIKAAGGEVTLIGAKEKPTMATKKAQKVLD